MFASALTGLLSGGGGGHGGGGASQSTTSTNTNHNTVHIYQAQEQGQGQSQAQAQEQAQKQAQKQPQQSNFNTPGPKHKTEVTKKEYEDLIKVLKQELQAAGKRIKDLETKLKATESGVDAKIAQAIAALEHKFRTQGLTVAGLGIGSEWHIHPEQPNEAYLVFRHSTYNRVNGDRRFAFNGNSNFTC